MAEPVVGSSAQGAGAQVQVKGLDHIVLNVSDAEVALRFYCGTLGLSPIRVDAWRAGQAPFPSARVNSGTIIDLLETERSGVNSDHFCLEVEPVDFDALARSGSFEVLEGPAARFGARGTGTSLYVRDPDGNTVELRYYDPAGQSAPAGETT